MSEGRARAHPRLPLGSPGFVRALAALYAVVFLVAGWRPLDRRTWLLENLLVFALVALLYATRRRLVFSRLSCLLVFAFLLLHALGSHYTYSQVPVGFFFQEALGLARNHYDRFVHFAFGLLLAYPLRELTLRRIHAHRVWSYGVPVALVLSCSATYEIIEWLAALYSDPEVGIAYVGAQGDVWDGQKDMGLAFAGAVSAMLATALWRRVRGREPYLALEPG